MDKIFQSEIIKQISSLDYKFIYTNDNNASDCNIDVRQYYRNISIFDETDIRDNNLYCDYVILSNDDDWIRWAWQIQFNSELVDKEKLFKVLEILIIKTDDEIDINELSSLMKPLFKDCNFAKKEYFKK